MLKDWLVEAATQARNAIPVPLAFIGEGAGWFNLDYTIKVLGGVYLVLQIAFLIWKWRRAHRDGR